MVLAYRLTELVNNSGTKDWRFRVRRSEVGSAERRDVV
jgi:hypothetical protein